MPYYNQYFRSTDLNSPPLTGQTNSAIVVLNACLVDGYGWDGMAITSITRSGTTATATVSAANGLKLKTGMILTISGATGADASLYNGTFTITVASTTTFTYTMSGTPTGSATGTPVASSKLIISFITRSGTTATATVLNANNTLTTNDYLTIEGCTGADASLYNGTFKITVTSTTTFTYTMSGTPTGSATGTPTYYKSGLQWTRPFAAGTNSQTYRSADTSSNQFYLQIIDNAATAGGAKEAQAYGAEVMSADQTVTSGRFPTAANLSTGLIFRKSTTADNTERGWSLAGDGRTFHARAWTGDAAFTSGVNYHILSFGHFITFKSGDAYNTFIAGNFNANTTNTTSTLNLIYLSSTSPVNTTDSLAVARLYSQTGSGIAMRPIGATNTSGVVIGTLSSGGLTSPNSSDNGYYVWPLLVLDQTGNLRGRIPGIYWAWHGTPFQEGDEIINITNLSNVTLINELMSSNNTTGQRLIDKWGPWT